MNFLLLSYIITHLVFVIVGLYVFYISLKRFIDTRIDLLLLIVLFGVGIVLVNLNLIIPLVIDIDFRITAVLHTLLFVSGFCILILFFNLFQGELSPVRFGFAIVLFITTLFLTAAGLIYDFSIIGEIYESNNMISFVWGPLPSIIISVGMIAAGYFGYRDLTQSLQYALNQFQISKIKKMRIATLSIFGALLFAIPGYYFGVGGEIELSIWFAMVLAWIPTIIGFYFLGDAYAGSNQVAFLQPQRVDALLVIHETGLPLVEYEFRHDILSVEMGLISGAMEAIKSLMAEAFQIYSHIERIVFKDRNILLNITEEASFVLITTRPTQFLFSALNQFSSNFHNKYEKYIQNFDGDISKFNGFEPLIKQSFGL